MLEETDVLFLFINAYYTVYMYIEILYDTLTPWICTTCVFLYISKNKLKLK